MKLTNNEQGVLEYLRGKEWVSPTQIGHEVGGRIESHYGSRLRHSSWASPICLRLTNTGLLQRNDKGHYRNPER